MATETSRSVAAALAGGAAVLALGHYRARKSAAAPAKFDLCEPCAESGQAASSPMGRTAPRAVTMAPAPAESVRGADTEDAASCTVSGPRYVGLSKDADSAVKRESYIDWDDYFMSVAMLSAFRSKDPNRQVGACIVDPQSSKIVGIGYNGFPWGCNDDSLPWARDAEKWEDTKYPYVCHAEMNAILNKNRPRSKDVASTPRYSRATSAQSSLSSHACRASSTRRRRRQGAFSTARRLSTSQASTCAR